MRLARLSAGIISLLCIGAGFVSAQEALLSVEENYYQFLSLDGSIEKPYLNYRTLSDSSWDVSGIEGPWAGELLGGMKSLTEDMSYRLYGPSLYTSWNSAAPYGQNDGVLWQGKGFNSSFSAGARLEGFGFELTLKPEVSFSQNLSFDLVAPNTAYSGNDAYAGKAGEYGYYGIASIDAPQRFGDDSFYTLSWGDSEIRYTWKTLTAGFGTQLIWLGPARINPILHSNNAAPYPKADIGIRPTQVELPYLGWNLGKVEARTWVGQLSESDWFDNNPDNDRNMISGLTVSWAPSFLEGLTLSANRV
ncbi:MAG TPA: capsule assembly Wzi family protein, partial [Treponemataceae bacterium]|nr:capsule assembly Wzi family protein [Treponemataceae bacterium]